MIHNVLVTQYTELFLELVQRAIVRQWKASSIQNEYNSCVFPMGLCLYIINRYQLFERAKMLSGAEDELAVADTGKWIAFEMGRSEKSINRDVDALKKAVLIKIRKGKIVVSRSQYRRMLELRNQLW